MQNGEENVSKALSKPERNYCVTMKELLAINHFHKYLYGREFLIGILTMLLYPRWVEKLQLYDFKIWHRPGRNHNADVYYPEDCVENENVREGRKKSATLVL